MAGRSSRRASHVPPFVKAFNPIARRFAGGSLYALLRHRGRKSGRRYETPVVALATAAGIVVPVNYGLRTDWLQNIMAAGEAEIKLGGRWRRLVEPRLLAGAAARPFLPAPFRLFTLAFPASNRFLLLRESEPPR